MSRFEKNNFCEISCAAGGKCKVPHKPPDHQVMITHPDINTAVRASACCTVLYMRRTIPCERSRIPAHLPIVLMNATKDKLDDVDPSARKCRRKAEGRR